MKEIIALGNRTFEISYYTTEQRAQAIKKAQDIVAGCSACSAKANMLATIGY